MGRGCCLGIPGGLVRSGRGSGLAEADHGAEWSQTCAEGLSVLLPLNRNRRRATKGFVPSLSEPLQSLGLGE